MAASVLHSFSGGTDGAQPLSGLIFDSSGALYGTTWRGGAQAAGVAFKLARPASAGGAWTESAFRLSDRSGGRPRGSFTPDTFGGLFATATRSSVGNCLLGDCGSILRLTPPRTAGGPWIETVLANFDGANGGAAAVAQVFLGGSLYGAAEFGGSANVGVVFRLSP